MKIQIVLDQFELKLIQIRYIRVIGEVADYYGVHEIIAFDIRPVSSGNEVTHHFLEVAYSYEKRLESVEDEMMKSVLLV